MDTICVSLAVISAGAWMAILFMPWRPWSTREFLDAPPPIPEEDLGDITVVIPARNERETIGAMLQGLGEQGSNLKIILVDDQSSNGTFEAARNAAVQELRIISGKPLPLGWSGKLWALEQGRQRIKTPLTLMIDADIELSPGILGAMRELLRQNGLHLVSLMAVLPTETFWEKLLMPAFVYFFKLLYPFALSNSRFSRVAAAAGGCILIETRVLTEIGGFRVIRGELIDDCALAQRVKSLGFKTWIGLTHSVRSLRRHNRLRTIWNIVARTAFTQLQYSGLLLTFCTALLLVAFWVSPLVMGLGNTGARCISAVALGAMILSYLPTLQFYGLSKWWALTMPFTGTLYLAMTWTSAIRHWLGRGSEWKGRTYSSSLP
jgi:hopene-associated glycosyltransferase HpnB